MSTLSTTNLKNPNSVSNNVALNTDGSASVQAGTAAAPGIQASGDSNTGVFFPAADTVGVATAGSERVRVDSNGSLLVGVTSGNANGGILQLSEGITFPAAQVAASDANTLDDYEEGTWTVNFYDAATGGNASSTTGTGYYTKIGRVVCASFVMSSVSTAGMTAANDLNFTLPFTSAGGAFSLGSSTTSGVTFASGRTAHAPYVAANSARGRFSFYGSGVNTTNMIVSNLTSGSAGINVNVTYIA